MSTWDEVGRELYELATLRGGPRDIYKPVIRIEYYEHDDCLRVEVGRCKGMENILACASIMAIPNAQGHEYDPVLTCATGLLEAIRAAKVEAMSAVVK